MHTLASQNLFPPSCAHRTQTLIILKISNTIQFPTNGQEWNRGGCTKGTWGLFSSNPLDTSASEVKPSCPACRVLLCYPSSPAPFPNRSHRRDTVNFFSQQRALEVWGGKKVINLPTGNTPRHQHNRGVCEHFRYLRAPGAAEWIRSGWEAHLVMEARPGG